jgi:hypothetical protein
MKAVQVQLGLFLLTAACAAAQARPATLRGLKVTHDNRGVAVEITLSAPISPSVLVTRDPHRLVLDFPNTTTANQRRVEVNSNDVRAVRYALHSADPLVTRVVVELEREHPYELHSDDNRVTLNVSSPVATKASRRRGPPAAGSWGIIGIFRRRWPESRPVYASEDNSKPSSSTRVPSSATSAAHPNQGIAQDGTVFPGAGSADSGNVPATGGPPISTAAPSASDPAASLPASDSGNKVANAGTQPMPGNVAEKKDKCLRSRHFN